MAIEKKEKKEKKEKSKFFQKISAGMKKTSDNFKKKLFYDF